MNLDSIATYLEDHFCGIVSESIFTAEMPEDATEGILLVGPYNGTQVNAELRGYFVTTFRLISRSASYDTGIALARKACLVLDSQRGYTLPDMQVRQCIPSNLPRPYRRSVGGFWEFHVDMEVVFVDSSA